MPVVYFVLLLVVSKSAGCHAGHDAGCDASLNAGHVSWHAILHSSSGRCVDRS